MLKSYPAKILLFGEYTILNGSKALAVPYSQSKGFWSFQNTDNLNANSSRNELMAFLESDHSKWIDHLSLEKDLLSGMWFDSSIPQGHGLGSSGALIAAIYDKYGEKVESILEKKNILASMENFFHGSSSGIDPLVSLLNVPLLIHSFNDLEVVGSNLDLSNFFLVDSGRPRNTGPLVSIYREKLKDPDFKRSCAEVLNREVNFAIDDVLSNNNKENLFHHLWLISKFQWDYFQEMIPDSFREIWSLGLDSGDYILKLCGAGGGGFILGFSLDIESKILPKKFESFEIKKLPSFNAL